MLNRVITLPPKQSFLLLGPRQTGKSTLIDLLPARPSWKVNLLHSDIFLKYARNPELFGKEASDRLKRKACEMIFVDEIQRVPDLLNEIQMLLDAFPGCQFILTG